MPSNKPPEVVIEAGQPRRPLLERLAKAASECWQHLIRYRHDNQVPGYVGPTLYRKFVKPWRARIMDWHLRPGYVSRSGLGSLEYAFFPLHTEPEVSLLVYNKPFLNQIEVARLLANSLPVHMKLVVKEHLCSVGKRKLSYYRKLLQIPNLVLAPPEMTARELVQHAQLVAVISGSVALEALILRKPVITLGRAPFNILPSSMLRHVSDLARLGFEVADLLARHVHDERALRAYAAAAIVNSVPVDLYSLLLGRAGAYSERDAKIDSQAERWRQLQELAGYFLRRLEGVAAAAA